MADRFDLEHHILECWRVVDDLALLHKAMEQQSFSEKDGLETLSGIKNLYNLKFSHLFNVFCEERNVDNYSQNDDHFGI